MTQQKPPDGTAIFRQLRTERDFFALQLGLSALLSLIYISVGFSLRFMHRNAIAKAGTSGKLFPEGY